MAIAFRSVGTIGKSTGVDTITAPGDPAGRAASDMLLLITTAKATTPPTTNAVTNYTAPATDTGTGGTGAAGAGTGGPVRASVRYRQATGDASDTPGTITFSDATASPGESMLLDFSKGAGETWNTPQVVTVGDTSGSTTDYDPAAAGSVLTLNANDLLVIVSMLNDEQATTIVLPGSISATGVTFGSVTNRVNDPTTTGNDGRIVVDTVPVTSGPASAGPDYAFSGSGFIANFSGVTLFIRLSVAAPVLGTAAAALGGLAASASGRPTVRGTAPAPLGGLSATAVGRVTVHGTAVAALGALGAGATGVIEGEVMGSASAALGGLAAHATGTVVPRPAQSAGADGWRQLIAIRREALDEARAERARRPVACPNDGEPLQTGPAGVLYCPWDGWQWPRDQRAF